MTSFDPNDFEAHQRTAQESVMREQAEKRVATFLARRPRRFAARGDLDPRILDWTRAMYRGEATSLVLAGGIGAGKTWSLWKAGETLIRNGWKGRFEIVEAYDLKRAARNRDEEQLARWTRADFLAIDDIGAIGMQDWDSDNLHTIINDRWKNGLPVGLTANNSADLDGKAEDLKAIAGPRAASRLQDEATFVVLRGGDRRRAA
ncbi:ATP-binding protein [Nocardiopsis alba]|uniref:ATP-binding protein n=1 Tax=Nocardiopsis alba TaxID=53437 RepID=A0A7K2ILE0_9ACTN|nr:ATP-binding protein [Nocardiopsis alba]MYR30763.1 ATP-binding protein [Nocardiopsis alba]